MKQKCCITIESNEAGDEAVVTIAFDPPYTPSLPEGEFSAAVAIAGGALLGIEQAVKERAQAKKSKGSTPP